jgi:hypothetical protein
MCVCVLPSLSFVDDQGIRLCSLGTDAQHNAWDPMSEDVVVSALGIILDTDNYPLMIMCNLGRHRTGTSHPPHTAQRRNVFVSLSHTQHKYNIQAYTAHKFTRSFSLSVHTCEHSAAARGHVPNCAYAVGGQARWWAACASCSDGI